MTDRIATLLAALTLDEKATLVAGADMWHTPAVQRVGVPSVKVSDGPSGVRGERFTGTTSTSFPCGTALAATWDPVLVRRVGAAIADEARDKGVHVVLGPTVNIHRHPLAGRNFECYSEDPYLTSRTAVAYIEGVQGRGVGCCVKHFVANDSEYERMTISSEVPERALHEIYLPPFEAAVREAGVWSVMSAYNRVGGTYCGEHRHLLREILKEEWGFDGLVVSDWFGTHSTVEAASAGLDLEMPGPPLWFGAKLAAAVREGAIAEDVVDEMVRRLLRLAERTGALAGGAPVPEQSVDDPERRAVAGQAATEAIVLLRNEGALLPLRRSELATLAVVGPNAQFFAVQGGGSAGVTPHRHVSPVDALRERAGAGVEVVFERGVASPGARPPLAPRWLAGGSLRLEYRNGTGFEGAPVHAESTAPRGPLVWFGGPGAGVDAREYTVRATATFVPDESGAWTFALTSVGRSRLLVDGEVVVDNWDAWQQGSTFFGLGSTEVTAELDARAGEAREIAVEYASAPLPIGALLIGCHPPVAADALDRAVAAAARADAVVVVVGTSSEIESEGHDRASFHLPSGQDDLVARVAAANPRTVVVVNVASPVAMDWAADVGAILQVWFPGQEGADALTDILFGRAVPSGRLPTSVPVRIEDTPAFTSYPGEAGKVHYGEGIFVGYRWYDARRIEPRFPFGHGLSYTTFEHRDARVEPARAAVGAPATVSVEVTNTGEYAGAEVVQCYVADLEASVVRPEQELAGFARVHLEPGETRTVTIPLDARAFAFWHPGRRAWTEEPGLFEVRIGASSRDVRAVVAVERR